MEGRRLTGGGARDDGGAGGRKLWLEGEWIGMRRE